MADNSRRIQRLLLNVIGLCVLLSKYSNALQEHERILINKPATNWSTSATGDVRCYCNLPMCVGTSYMCRSERGGCFSDLTERGPNDRPRTPQEEVYGARHGCLELLSELHQGVECQNSPRGASAPAGGLIGAPVTGEGLLLCCFKDMCNHVDNPETRRTLNATRAGMFEKADAYGNGAMPTTGYTSNEVWFKAATIAVPICGALILFMLIALAVKILKTDGIDEHSNKLGSHYVSQSSDHKSFTGPYDQYHQPTTNSLNCMPLLLQTCETEGANVPSCINHSADKFTTVNSPATIPLLVQNQTKTKSACEKKNEANAKLNLVSNLEYSLLPCSRTSEIRCNNLNKPSNNAAAIDNGLYKNLNLNPNSQSANNDPKLYNKNIGWGELYTGNHV